MDDRLQPFAFIELPPARGSPAEKAGLRAGDGIIKFGNALELADVSYEIRTGVPIRITVLTITGHLAEYTVVPRQFDPHQPEQLLGCQLVSTFSPGFIRPKPNLQATATALAQGPGVSSARTSAPAAVAPSLSHGAGNALKASRAGGSADKVFALLETEPPPGSPAAVAGLTAGDGIIRFGDATTLAAMTAELRSAHPIEVTVLNKRGQVVQHHFTIPGSDGSTQQPLGLNLIEVVAMRGSMQTR
eukprot:6200417-Pleurochrysis_carterae.AAC.1